MGSTGDKIKGKANELIGKATGDTSQEVKGKAQQGKGKAKDKASRDGDPTAARRRRVAARPTVGGRGPPLPGPTRPPRYPVADLPDGRPARDRAAPRAGGRHEALTQALSRRRASERGRPSAESSPTTPPRSRGGSSSACSVVSRSSATPTPASATTVGSMRCARTAGAVGVRAVVAADNRPFLSCLAQLRAAADEIGEDTEVERLTTGSSTTSTRTGTTRTSPADRRYASGRVAPQTVRGRGRSHPQGRHRGAAPAGRHRRGRVGLHDAEAGRRVVQGPVPVPHREDPVLHGQAGRQRLPLLRLRRVRRPLRLPDAHRGARVPRGRRGARPPHRVHAALRGAVGARPTRRSASAPGWSRSCRGAGDFFTRTLFGDEGAVARTYLKERGFGREDVDRFELGFAPNRWEDLSRALTAEGIRPEDLVTTGLAVRNDRGGLRDRFRGRLIFPVHDPGGDVIGFGGRILPELDYGDFDPPKYLNSPETAALQEDPGPLRRPAGPRRHRACRTGARLRGLHRRDGAAPGRLRQRRRDLRDRRRHRAPRRWSPATPAGSCSPSTATRRG
jgi:uncharacterized protein YjbJ (UPF0337 family)